MPHSQILTFYTKLIFKIGLPEINRSGVISIERAPPRFMQECTLNASGIFQFNSILNEMKNIVAHKGHYVQPINHPYI